MIEKLLEIQDLAVEYRTDTTTVYAVNHINLTIHKGEHVGLVGETGAGKTTTALSVLNLVPSPPGVVTHGKINFEGLDLLSLEEKRLSMIRGKKISMIFQDPMTSLNPVYTVGDQIAELILLHEKCSKANARDEACKMLELVGIPARRYDEYPHQFSGGMKQRVVIAMSIACSPDLILADEPTTALDVTIQAQVLELINELKIKFNTAMLLITHDLGVVAQVCDSVNIMYSGEIVESGSIPEVFDHPAHPYTMGLFSSIPTIEGTENRLIPIPGQMPDPSVLPDGCPFVSRCAFASSLCHTHKPKVTELDGSHKVTCLNYENQVHSSELMEAYHNGR